MKLIVREPESQALEVELGGWGGRVSSALLAVEAIRACARYGPRFARRAEAGLATMALIPLDRKLLQSAATLRPPELRSLDAVHLASALSVGSRLGALVCYDARLSAAARMLGLEVLRPETA